jgi:DNA adenine methylase
MVEIKPLIKWVGGKTQIIDSVFNLFPKEISYYYEPFIGGGSVLFELLNRLEKGTIKVDKIFIGDFNENLINLYNSIKTDLDQLIKYLNRFKLSYDSSPENVKEKGIRQNIEPLSTIKQNVAKSKEHVYYYYRKMYNTLKNSENKKSKRAALFIFLNKTSFRGVYRENSQGKFNVPFGNYNTLEMYDEVNLKKCNELFNKYNVQFIHKNFYDWKEKITYDKKTFIYMDPPYYPENETSFTSYTANDFNLDQHKKLIELCKYIANKKSNFLLSNSDTSFIKNSLKEFKIQTINLKRQINSKNPGATTNEVFIYN